jgi:glutamate synthase (NADPH) small chain
MRLSNPGRPSKSKGFMVYGRELPPYQTVEERVRHWHEFNKDFDNEKMRTQAYRCMNCGIPFCQSGCPLGNIIPDWNDLVKDDNWREAYDRLMSTNNFPEVTGRVCPAPCESSCVLGITDPAVTIKLIERSVADRGIREGWLMPQPPEKRTGKNVAVVGSGPAGLAAAQQLNRAGHNVTLYERDDMPGGLMVYGIPDFKMEKSIVQMRVEQMKQEGVTFQCNTEIGKDISAEELTAKHDAVLLCIGATVPRDLPVPGRDLKGIHFAMEYLPQQNRRVAGRPVHGEEILAKDKNVIVIGGGDTGSDCLGTSIRQGAKKIVNFELLPKPPEDYNPETPWPTQRPLILNVSSSHQEGGERDWCVLTKKFTGENGHVKQLHAVRIEWVANPAPGAPPFQEIPGSEFILEADLVLLALGFVHPEPGIAEELGLERDARGNIQAAYEGPEQYRTSNPKVFAAGDARRGQSLVVWAIHEGREAARAVDLALMGYSDLPSAFSHGYDALASG